MSSPLDSRQLKAFLALAKTGSFTAAAKELFLSQSAVSHSMKALEEDVGCLILDRVGKKVLLTQAGEQLLHYAEQIFSEMETARTSLKHLGKWGGSRLRIGASQSVCQYILPPVLQKLKEKYPQCLITIELGDTPAAMEKLDANAIDLALVLAPKFDLQCEFKPLFSDELSFLVPAEHPWVKKRSAVRVEIPKQNYILYDKNSYTHRMIESYFRREKMVLKTIIQVGSLEVTKELIKLGLGISVATPWIAQTELRDQSLVALPLGQRKLRRTWGLAHRPGRRLNLVEETFLELCRTAAPAHTHQATE